MGGLAIAGGAFVGMEGVAAIVHRFVMHGPGWRWHRSHHLRHDRLFEANDLYALLFAGVAVMLFVAGAQGRPVLWWLAAGTTGYGLVYALVHDCLVHRRFLKLPAARRGYLKRLVQAHQLHHAVQDKEGCVSFGFLYAPKVERLRARLKARA
ncbi:MAG TPA: sterol desaturase family protein [Allosphingosinicella sp.]|nr:sterol desaturase family protein [Allosphingosinicella sp.]